MNKKKKGLRKKQVMNRTTNKNLFLVCAVITIALVFAVPAAGSNDNLKRELEEQIRQKEIEIQEHQKNIEQSQQEAHSLKNEIRILENQIDKIYLEIKQVDLSIQRSTLDIQEVDEQIKDIENNVLKKKELLGEYLRTVARYDQETLLEVILKNDKFSDLFNEINTLEEVQRDAHDVLAEIRALKEQLAAQKEELEDERQSQNQLKAFQLVQKRSVEGVQWQKENLLDRTKGQEREYQRLIRGAETDIAHIKEQLSLLEKYNMTLDDAVQTAIFAASKTGIRPAFLLGVLEAESRLGLNTGTGNWEKDMYQCYRKLGYITRAEKEKTAFLQICEELGLNPVLQPVSAEPWYGCGGAMGIGQFMPTTWLAYREQVIAATGSPHPNPWVPRDAFMAAAIKLSQGGANQRTEIGERTAYAKYLAGGNYKKWLYHKIVTYVITLTGKFQEQYFE